MVESLTDSMQHAKTAHIFGHVQSGMGERSLALKYQRAIQTAGYQTGTIVDLIDLLGEEFESLAHLNYALADAEHSILEGIKKLTPLEPNALMIVLSWCYGVAAFFATNLPTAGRCAVKLFAHHTNERILKKLYDPADLILTESLLAAERGLFYGLDPKKLLFLPHCYPKECENITPSPRYVEDLAASLGKRVEKGVKVIGCVSRLEYGKNCEFAVEAVRQLALKKCPVVLILKGDFSHKSPYTEYNEHFKKVLESYREAPWLLWDRSHTPYPDVLQQYANFDLLLHLSGAEGGSHVVVECLGLQKPVVLLDCSTNPYLFKGAATFVKTTGELYGAQLPFYIPDMQDLAFTLEKELPAPCLHTVQERFHEQVLIDRIPLLFDADPEKIAQCYPIDRRRYQL